MFSVGSFVISHVLQDPTAVEKRTPDGDSAEIKYGQRQADTRHVVPGTWRAPTRHQSDSQNPQTSKNRDRPRHGARQRQRQPPVHCTKLHKMHGARLYFMPLTLKPTLAQHANNTHTRARNHTRAHTLTTMPASPVLPHHIPRSRTECLQNRDRRKSAHLTGVSTCVYKQMFCGLSPTRGAGGIMGRRA